MNRPCPSPSGQVGFGHSQRMTVSKKPTQEAEDGKTHADYAYSFSLQSLHAR